MDEQMTAGRVQDGGGGTRDEFRLWLKVGLPLYVAVTMTAVMVVLLAVPVPLYLLSISGSVVFDGPGGGIGAFFLALGSGVFVPGAVALALGMRAILNNLLRNGAELAGRERDVLSEVAVGLAILYTAFLPLIFMRHARPLNLLRSVLLGAAAGAGTLVVYVLLLLVFGDSGSVGLGVYLAIYALFALVLYAAAAAPAWRMMSRMHDKRLSRAVLIAAACGLAAGALTILLSYLILIIISLFGEVIVLFGLYLVLVLFLPILYVLIFLFMLPPLLRASAAYARLRNAGGSAP